MPDPTTNYKWDTPQVGGDSGSWGTLLNAIFNDLDTELGLVSTTASAAMPKAGGTFTGDITIKGDNYTAVNLGSISGVTQIDISSGRFFYGTVTGACTLSFTGETSSVVQMILIEITNGGSNVSWASAVKWPGGTAPALTASGVDVIAMYTRDNGSTWRAAIAQTDST